MTAQAQSCAGPNVGDRIAELQRRIAIYEKRHGDAQVALYEAKLAEEQANKDVEKAYEEYKQKNPSLKGWVSSSEYFRTKDKADAAKAKVAAATNRVNRLEHDIAGYRAEIARLAALPPCGSTTEQPLPKREPKGEKGILRSPPPNVPTERAPPPVGG